LPVERCLAILNEAPSLVGEEKRVLFRHMARNYGRTALCLSGGACLAYYHFVSSRFRSFADGVGCCEVRFQPSTYAPNLKGVVRSGTSSKCKILCFRLLRVGNYWDKRRWFDCCVSLYSNRRTDANLGNIINWNRKS